MRWGVLFVVAVCSLLIAGIAPAVGQSASGGASPSITVPPDYVIGAEDALSVVFWSDKEFSADVIVRPDGKISLPLLKDVQAAGYTPEQLAGVVEKAATKFIEQPTVTIIVREIRSRKVFIVGQVTKPGAFPIVGDMTVLQLIALAGDVLEYADAKHVTIVRKDEGVERRLKFNYRDVLKGKNVEQNILLKPGDTVIVP